MEELLTHETFAQNINTKFQAQLDENNYVELDLAQVSDVKVFPGQEQFAIVFVGPVESFLNQGLRIFRHKQIGQFELFIVPIAQDEKGFHYEAVFNRISAPVPLAPS